jgi:iron complex transport system permease protein
MTRDRLKLPLILGTGLLLIAVGLVLSVCLGAKRISAGDILGGIFGREKANTEQLIIWDLRLPRAISALFIGAFLAVSGAVIQGITRNPLASPSIMGVNQGAILAMAIYMSTQAVPGAMGKVFFAFIGASFSAALVFLLSGKRAGLDITRLLLAGTALGMLFSAMASMIALLSNNSKNLAFWIAGGLTGANWQSVRILLGASVVLVWVILISPKITILSLGDEVSIGLGDKPGRIRLLSLVCVVLLSGVAASIGGNIGFVCLIVPQIARILAGTDYRRVIPVSLVGGAALMLYSDVAARVLTSPFEIPVGSITSLIGVPALIYLVRKEKRV